jgi:hypothetical protein
MQPESNATTGTTTKDEDAFVLASKFLEQMYYLTGYGWDAPVEDCTPSQLRVGVAARTLMTELSGSPDFRDSGHAGFPLGERGFVYQETMTAAITQAVEELKQRKSRKR